MFENVLLKKNEKDLKKRAVNQIVTLNFYLIERSPVRRIGNERIPAVPKALIIGLIPMDAVILIYPKSDQ